MAKHNSPTSKSPMTYAKVGLLAWSHEKINVTRQTRRSKPERDYLRYCLAKDGWNVQLGVIPVFDKNSPIWGSDYQAILDETFEIRKAKHKSLLDNPEQPALDVFEKLFCEIAKDGKAQVMKPTMLANACHGRLEEYYEAMIVRASGKGYATLLGKKDEPTDFGQQDVPENLPVHLFTFSDEGDRLDEQIIENEGKFRGNKEVSPVDKMRNILMGFQRFGWTQKKAREAYPGSFGQRGWLLARANQLWSDNCPKSDLFPGETSRPTLGIGAGCLLKSNEEGHVPFQSFNKMDSLTEIVNRSFPDGLVKVNERIEKENRMRLDGLLSSPVEPVKKPATPEEVKEFFTGKKGTGVSDKMLDKNTWKNLSGSPCDLLKMVAEANLNNDAGSLGFLAEHSDVLNQVNRLLTNGDKSKLVAALALMRHPQFDELVNACLPEKHVKVQQVIEQVTNHQTEKELVS